MKHPSLSKHLLCYAAAAGLISTSCASSDATQTDVGSVEQAVTQNLPARIEAENFDRFYDTTPGHSGNCGTGPVDIQTTSDVGGGCNVGWTAPGEWLEYDFSADQSGTIDVSLRLASQHTGKTVRLRLDGADVSGAISVPSGGWQSFQDRTVSDIPVSAGSHTLRVLFETGSANLNYLDVSEVVSDGVSIPSRVEAEDYARFSDTTAGNTGGACDRGDDVDLQLTSDSGGGCNVGWTAAGEWLEYDLHAANAGTYAITARLASKFSNRVVEFEIDGQSYGQLTAPGNGWQAFANRTISNVPLSAGNHVLRVTFISGQTNLNYIDVQSEAANCSTPLSLTWPMPGSDGADWVINNYVDLENGSGVLDYAGGAKTYDGHRGVDIDVATFRDMDGNFPILAAAPGVVESIVDGNFDRNLSCNGQWNAVTLRHANGWSTLYGHLKLNSATVQVGDAVLRGQQLGVVGSSGCSTQAHLHLETRDCNDLVLSPFEQNLLLDAPVYDPPFSHMETVLLAGGFDSDDSIAREQMLDPAPNAQSVSVGELLGFGVHMGGGLIGETLDLQFRRPDGSVQFLFNVNLSETGRHQYWYWSTTANGAAGNWFAEALVNGQVVSSTPFTRN